MAGLVVVIVGIAAIIGVLLLGNSSERSPALCTLCGIEAQPISRPTGSGVLEALLYLIALGWFAVLLLSAVALTLFAGAAVWLSAPIPAVLLLGTIIYSIVRRVHRRVECAHCAATQLIPPDSPFAERYRQGRHET